MDFWKAVTTLGVWAAVVAISIVLNLTNSGMGWLVSIVAIVFGFVTTMQVWEKGRVSERSVRAAESFEKAKRSSDPETRMRLLMEMMDDDERQAFKQAMKEPMLSVSRDGELNYDADSLGALLDEDERPRRQR
jgi:hypothetical protein